MKPRLVDCEATCYIYGANCWKRNVSYTSGIAFETKYPLASLIFTPLKPITDSSSKDWLSFSSKRKHVKVLIYYGKSYSRYTKKEKSAKRKEKQLTTNMCTNHQSTP